MRHFAQAGAALAVWLALVSTVSVWIAPGWAASGRSTSVQITPHRAVYALDLLRSSSSSGIIGTRGSAYFEWARTCEGYLVNQHVRMQLALSESQSSVAVLLFSSFESADGRRMSFKLRQTADGAITEELEGIAELGPEGGVAHIALPERKDVTLPAGTMFPSVYTGQALATMVAGDALFAGFLFDGSTADGAYEVTTFYGPAENRPIPGGKPGESETFWPNRASYFQADSGDAEPLFEVGSMVNAGGVAEWFDLDYGSFSVRASLTEFERLPEPKC